MQIEWNYVVTVNSFHAHILKPYMTKQRLRSLLKICYADNDLFRKHDTREQEP